MANTTNTQTNTTVNNRVFQIVERSAFSLAPSGNFAAALVSLAFLGEHQRTVKQSDGTEETKTLEYVGLTYEILDKNSGEVHLVMEECSLSYNPDSKLYSRIIALNGGKPLEAGQDLRVLLGKSAKVEIIHKLSEGANGVKRMYANVSTAVELPSTMQAHPVSAKPVYYDVLKPDAEAFSQLNRKHQNIISRALGATSDAAQAA